MTDFRFTEVVKVGDKLKRDYSDGLYFWNSQTIEPCLAVFLGTRTLKNGRMHTVEVGGSSFMDIPDTVAEFIADELIKVALVVTSQRTNPFYCSLDKIQKVTHGEPNVNWESK